MLLSIDYNIMCEYVPSYVNINQNRVVFVNSHPLVNVYMILIFQH